MNKINANEHDTQITFVCRFQIFLSCHALVIYALFLFLAFILSCELLTVKRCGIKKSYAITKARVYIAKLIQDPIWTNKMRKVNILIIYYKALGQIHYIHKINKNKCAKRNYIRKCEGVGPFKGIKLELKIDLIAFF